MFLPGAPCSCCGGGGGGPSSCPACEDIEPECLRVTFSGFSHGTGNCSECNFLDDVTFELKRPEVPQAAVEAVVLSATGPVSGVSIQASVERDELTGNYSVSSLSLTGGKTASYSPFDSVAFTANACVLQEPQAHLSVNSSQPAAATLRLAGPSPGGTPATVGAIYTEQVNEQGNRFWVVSATGTISGGSGYANGQQVSLLSDEQGDVVHTAATAQIVSVGGQPQSLSLLTGGIYYRLGPITGVTLASGGEIAAPFWCRYESDPVCAVCPPAGPLYKAELSATLTLGVSTNTVSVIRRDVYYLQNGKSVTQDFQIVEATQSAVDENGARITCDNFTFPPESVAQPGCLTPGTVTVEHGDCAAASLSTACDFPDQILLSASGIPAVFKHRFEDGFEPWISVLAAQCGIGSYCRTPWPRPGGGEGGVKQVFLESRDESAIVLDRVQAADCTDILYVGSLPTLPAVFLDYETNEFGEPIITDPNACGGQLFPYGGTGGRDVAVAIQPVAADTSVSISAPPYGFGKATAEATVSGGQVSAITLTNGGSGYAREVFSRVEPAMVVSLQGGTGAGAVLSATMSQVGDGESAYWQVAEVIVEQGGGNYNGTEKVVFTPESGTTVELPAAAAIVTQRIEPTVTASVSGGVGAVLSVTLGYQEEQFTWLPFWNVSSVDIVNGGSGYQNNIPVTFTVTDGVQQRTASATAFTGSEQPSVTASVTGSSGTGAVFDVQLTPTGTGTWRVNSGSSALAIVNGGSGYAVGNLISFSSPDQRISPERFAVVTGVSASGAVTQTNLSFSIEYYRSNGVISSVQFSDRGYYFKASGVVQSVQVQDGGRYYKTQSAGVETATPIVTINSNVGEGAAATASVDSSPESPTFGAITGISVTNGGSGYGSGGNRWRLGISYDGLYHTKVVQRISSGCPAELLSKSYDMGIVSKSFVDGFDAGCGEPDSVSYYEDGTADYKWEGISVSLSPA